MESGSGGSGGLTDDKDRALKNGMSALTRARTELVSLVSPPHEDTARRWQSTGQQKPVSVVQPLELGEVSLWFVGHQSVAFC